MNLISLDSHVSEDYLPTEGAPHFRNGRFQNIEPITAQTWMERLALWRRFMFAQTVDAEPDQPIPVHRLTREKLLSLPDDRSWLVRLGHSGVLLKMGGRFWLIDPVFSERASPFAFAGPRRFHPAPIDVDELPPVEGVLISHNHYDHLDESAIRQLHEKVERFYVPLGVGGDLVHWGVPEEKITEFDWWQAEQVGGVTLVAMPAQHFSGRGLGDENRTLWLSWALRSADARIFYSGDTGYFDEFKRIGKEYGPFDLTLLETGAYDQAWPQVHMQPEETMQAHIDLRGRQLLPVHNSTFRLAFHSWYEPLERITRLAAEHDVPLVTPEIGQVIQVNADIATPRWWRKLMPAESVASVIGSGKHADSSGS